MDKKYLIKTLNSPDSIDWENVECGNIDVNGWNSIPEYISYFQLVFIKEYGFKLKLSTQEKNPWSTYHKDGEPVFLDSCLEAFLYIGEEGYINLETNSVGARIQGLGKDRYGRLSILNIDFSVKNEISNDQWNVVIDIPLEKLKNVYPTLDIEMIKSGFAFKGNFYKTGKNPENGLEHYYMWNKVDTPSPDFHQPTYFGNLIIR